MQSFEFDVIVVGGGGSALATAISAAEGGCSVVLLEKSDKLGGSTGMSIGSVTAAGTSLQRRAGINDSAEEHLADMPAWAGTLVERDNKSLLWVMTAHGADTLEWLIESGIAFVGPFPEPPHRKPRMHNVVPNSRAFVYHLSRRAQRAGVDIRLNTRVVSLILESGKVTGVNVEAEGKNVRYGGRRGIVLAGGDINASREYKEALGHEDQLNVPAVNPLSTGDCQRMGVAVGGSIVNADIALQDIKYRFLPPEKPSVLLSLPPFRFLTASMSGALRLLPSLLSRPFVMKFLTAAMAPELAIFTAPGVVMLNKKGEVVSLQSHSIGAAIAKQPGAIAYLVLDNETATKFDGWPNYVSTAPGVAYAYVSDYLRGRPDICCRCRTLSALASRLSIGVNAVRQAVKGIGSGPYVVMGPLHAQTVLADGGLAVSTRGEVLDSAGEPIPGLFAVGSAGQGGLLLRGHGHHLAWAFTSGRLTGNYLCDKQ